MGNASAKKQLVVLAVLATLIVGGALSFYLTRSSSNDGDLDVGEVPRQQRVVSKESQAKAQAKQHERSTLATRIASTQESERQQALQKLQQQLKKSPRSVLQNLGDFTPALMNAGEYEQLESLTGQAVLIAGSDTSRIESALETRVSALLADGQNLQALGDAKSLWNVATLQNTEKTARLVADTIAKAGSPDAAQRFCQEVAGAATSDGRPTILGQIQVDRAPYDKAIQKLEGKADYRSLMARGNLQLLADHPVAAQKCFVDAFDRALPTHEVRSVRLALEGVARSLRAQGDFDAAIRLIASTQDGQEPSPPPVTGVVFMRAPEVKVAAQQLVLPAIQAVVKVPSLEADRQSHDQQAQNPSPSASVRIVSDFEGATPVQVQTFSSSHLHVTLKTRGFRDFFLFQMRGCKGKTIRVDIDGADYNIHNWLTLNPVFVPADTLGDPAIFDFSADIDEQGSTTTKAWNGSGLPSIAGQAWQWIENCWSPDEHTFSFVQRFESDAVFIAMRVPYPVSYNERFISGLKNAPNAQVVEIGRSRRDRPLLLVRIGASESKSNPSVLIYAGEHADEPDAMWVAHDAIDYLLSADPQAQALRQKLTFLVIPIFDPDCSTSGEHEAVINSFGVGSTTPESIAWANWFQRWVTDGSRLDLVLDLHNVQSRESVQLACALREGAGVRGRLAGDFHQEFYRGLSAEGFTAKPNPWVEGFDAQRLGGWLAGHYGPLCFHYEFNSQAPSRHLNLAQLHQMARILVDSAAKFCEESKLLAEVDVRREQWRGTPLPERAKQFSGNAIIAEALRAQAGMAKE